MTCTLSHIWDHCTPGMTHICLHPALGVSSAGNSGLQETSTHSGNSIHHSATPEAAAICYAGKSNSHWDPTLLPGPGRQDRATTKRKGQGCESFTVSVCPFQSHYLREGPDFKLTVPCEAYLIGRK